MRERAWGLRSSSAPGTGRAGDCASGELTRRRVAFPANEVANRAAAGETGVMVTPRPAARRPAVTPTAFVRAMVRAYELAGLDPAGALRGAQITPAALR